MLFRVGEGTGEDEDDDDDRPVGTVSNGLTNPAYGSTDHTKQLPPVVFSEKSGLPPIAQPSLPPIAQPGHSPPPPYENGTASFSNGQTNGGFKNDDGVNTVIRMDGLPKQNFAGMG